jgi:hypothetical protein
MASRGIGEQLVAELLDAAVIHLANLPLLPLGVDEELVGFQKHMLANLLDELLATGQNRLLRTLLRHPGTWDTLKSSHR